MLKQFDSEPFYFESDYCQELKGERIVKPLPHEIRTLSGACRADVCFMAWPCRVGLH